MLLNALSYFHFLFQVQIKTWFLYTLRTSFEISKQTCMYSYTNILSTLLLTYILQCKNKEYSSFVIISCKVYLKVMNYVFRAISNFIIYNFMAIFQNSWILFNNFMTYKFGNVITRKMICKNKLSYWAFRMWFIWCFVQIWASWFSYIIFLLLY